MKKALLQLGTWLGLLGPSAPGTTRTATAALSPPQAINCVPALMAALAICGLLGAISLLVPPFINWDSANGFLAWRGTLLGSANSISSPDPANIARDTVWFLTVWSPGQYLVPGAISLLGVPLGVAMTLTAALALLVSLIGWVMVVRTFTPRTSLALLIVVLIGTFHYSTHAFSTYHGGEILLQAATPWLVLTADRVPEMDAIPAALLAAGAVFFALFAKLTGLIVVAAALIAGSMVTLAFGRRITHGMMGGAFGAMAAFFIVFFAFFGGSTSVLNTSWSLPFRNIAFAFLVPWVVGLSWLDPIGLIFFPNGFTYVPLALFALVVPPALLGIGLVLFWRPQTTGEKKFRLFSMCFYGVVAAVFSLFYIHGSILPEDRYFRSAGTLLFVCALMSALAAGTPGWTRGLFLALSALMAIYGLGSFSYHELTTAPGQFLDRTSWTNQRIFDAAAIDFTKEIFAREGRNALFVLPSYQLAVTLPVGARILVVDLNYEGDKSKIAGHYYGRVPGHVVVLLTNSISETSEGRALLSAFADYDPHAWKRNTFADMNVFVQ